MMDPAPSFLINKFLIRKATWVAFSDGKRNIGTQHALTNTTRAHEYDTCSRIQKKLTNTEETHEYSRSS